MVQVAIGPGTLGLPDTRAYEPGQKAEKDPSQEYIVGGPWAGYVPSGGYLIAQAIDDVIRQYGPWVYELMRLDPAVYGSLCLLFAAALAEGPRVVSSLTAEPGEQVKSRRRQRELRIAGEIADYWQRQVDALTPDFDQVIWELLDDCATGGCTLAEPVYTEEPIESGPDKGRLGLKSFTLKPRWSWGMRVDPYMRVQRIRGWTVDGWRDIAREHFVLMSWMPRNGDPRGTRILRPAYPAWNLKLQATPDYGEYLKHHADPKLILTAGPNMEASYWTDPNTGQRCEEDPQRRLLRAGQFFKNGSVMALANGDTAQYLYSQGNGEPFLKGFDWSDREIFRSTILGTRPMQEAKHGSKADTDSGLDLVGMAVAQTRKVPRSAIRKDLFYVGTMLNWGKDIADHFTPHLTFGVSEHIGAEIMTALANAWSKGVFQVPQRAWMLARLGAPADPEDYTPTIPTTAGSVPGAATEPADPNAPNPDTEAKDNPDAEQDDDKPPVKKRQPPPGDDEEENDE